MEATVSIHYRKIIPADNVALAKIIRNCLEEFNAAKPGTVYFDETTDRLSEVFATGKSAYFVAEVDGKLAGGAGYYPTEALDDDTCELVKLYLCPQARGKGIGKALMLLCQQEAALAGYTKIYLETMPELSQAVPLYEKMGYRYLEKPLGCSGHSGCSMWMLKSIA